MRSPRLMLIMSLAALAGSTCAQQPAGTCGAFPGAYVGPIHFGESSPAPRAVSPLVGAPPLELFDFDESYPVHDWIFPAQYTPLIIISLGQRFTLPSAHGFVDSILIRIDSMATGSAQINIYADSLFTVQGGRQFHLINVWTGTGTLGSYDVQSSDVRPGSFISIPFPHVKVDRNFHIVIGGTVNGSGQITAVSSVMTLAASTEPVRERTTDNARSTSLVSDQQNNLYSIILDSTFTFSGSTTPAFANFHVVAYVDTSGANTVTDHPSTHRPIAITSYPNPTHDVTTLHMEQSSRSNDATLHLYDALGRLVADMSDRLNTSTNTDLSISTSSLPPGVYCARFSEAGRITHTTMIVRR